MSLDVFFISLTINLRLSLSLTRARTAISFNSSALLSHSSHSHLPPPPPSLLLAFSLKINGFQRRKKSLLKIKHTFLRLFHNTIIVAMRSVSVFNVSKRMHVCLYKKNFSLSFSKKKFKSKKCNFYLSQFLWSRSLAVLLSKWTCTHCDCNCLKIYGLGHNNKC